MWNPAILDGRTRSKFGDQGEYGEFGKMETSTISLKTLSFSTRLLKTLFYTALIATVEKIITSALGEYDYESAHRRPPSHFEPL